MNALSSYFSACCGAGIKHWKMSKNEAASVSTRSAGDDAGVGADAEGCGSEAREQERDGGEILGPKERDGWARV
ncbi:hypothetical protein FCM35_KLT10159 [Carex littledalei]|uniref:Uncharacterized protein n=1 Tax=Carex littledalei TaxID=544730 RepID=A0A833R2J5_9POAL|nr:hypothetical protein FCM35_KLT10159 [Carex littledalei]